MSPRQRIRLGKAHKPSVFDDQKTNVEIQDAEMAVVPDHDQFVSYILSVLRQIKGTADWKDVPADDLAGLAARDGSQLEVGAPTDGDYTDGAVTIDPTDSISDAVDALNVGLSTVTGFLNDRVGWVRLVSVTVPGGTVDPTHIDPGNTILDSVIVSNGTFNVLVESANPAVALNGGASSFLPKVGDIYRGSLPFVLGASGPLEVESFNPDGGGAAKHEIDVTIDAPPAITSAIFTSGYPGSQTELKEGDVFDLEVTADKNFDQVIIADSGACKSASIGVVTGLTATVAVTIADRGVTAQQLGATLQVRDAVTGALSASYATTTGGAIDGVNVVTLNNLQPSGSIGVINYPGVQGALKGVESATVNHTAADFDTIAYVDPTAAQLTIEFPGVYAPAKGVTLTNPSVFNNSTINFRYTMTRTANDSQTIVSGVVAVADTPVVMSAILPAARLISGGNKGTSPQDHSITLSGSQPLLDAPSMSPDSGGSRGVFQGGGFTGSGATWSRALRVTDNDDKGVFSWESLVATNLAGTVTSVITSGPTYELGGCVARDLTYAALDDETDAGVLVTDFSKVQAGIFTITTNQSVKYPIGTPAPEDDGYTLTDLVTDPSVVKWLDTTAVNLNVSGTAQLIAFEELP